MIEQHRLINRLNKLSSVKVLTRGGSPFLPSEIASRLLSKLEPIVLQPLKILQLGSAGDVTKQLTKRYKNADIFILDLSYKEQTVAKKSLPWFSKQKFICAQSQSLPFMDNCFDMVISNLANDWLFDIEKVFSEVYRVLNPDGLFIYSCFGPDSLHELKSCWLQIDSLPHVNEYIDMHDLGDLISQNGFSDPVMEMESLRFLYRDTQNLLNELREMRVGNLSSAQAKGLYSQKKLQQLSRRYDELRDQQNKIPASFEIIYGHAWVPKNKHKQSTDDAGNVYISMDELKRSLNE